MFLIRITRLLLLSASPPELRLKAVRASCSAHPLPLSNSVRPGRSAAHRTDGPVLCDEAEGVERGDTWLELWDAPRLCVCFFFLVQSRSVPEKHTELGWKRGFSKSVTSSKLGL